MSFYDAEELRTFDPIADAGEPEYTYRDELGTLYVLAAQVKAYEAADSGGGGRVFRNAERPRVAALLAAVAVLSAIALGGVGVVIGKASVDKGPHDRRAQPRGGGRGGRQARAADHQGQPRGACRRARAVKEEMAIARRRARAVKETIRAPSAPSNG